MEEEWLTIAEIAQRTHLAENTARRYAKLFTAFLPSRTPGRTKHYAPTALPVLTRVAALYQTGHTTGDILDLLPQEFPRLVDAEAAADSSPAAPLLPALFLGPLFTQLVAQMDQQSDDLAALRAEVELLRQQHAKDQQRHGALDPQIVDALRHVLAEHAPASPVSRWRWPWQRR